MTGLFTLDTIVALLIAVTMMTAAMSIIGEKKSDTTENLYQVSQDILLLGEKTGDLSKVVDGDPSGIEEYDMLLKNRVCFELRIKNQSDILIYYYETDCDKKNSYTIAKRSFVHNRNFYIADMKAWYR